MKRCCFLLLIAGWIVVFASCSQRPETENYEQSKTENYEQPKTENYEQPKTENYERPEIGNYDITTWTDIAGNVKVAVIYNGELREYSVENGSLSFIRSDSTNS